MKCLLAMYEPIDFAREYPRGVMGKMGSVTMHYQCSEYYDGFNKKLSEALEKMLNSRKDEDKHLCVAVILKEPQSLCQGVLQLVDEGGSFLKDVNGLPGIDNIHVKVTLSQSRESAWPNVEEISPPPDIVVSKEMLVLNDPEKTCEDNAVQFQDDNWYEMFKTRGETISVRISIEVTVNSSLNMEQTNSNLTSIYEKMLYDDRHSDVVMVAKDGTQVKCHKAVLAACSSAFATIFRADVEENSKSHQVEMPEMSEQGVQSFLEYVYYQGVDEPNKDSEVALEMLMAADKYDDIPNIETTMSNIFLSKPATWYDLEVAWKLFVFARSTGRDELKMKAVQVLKQHAAALQENGAKLFKDNPDAALELCFLAFSS